MMSHASGMEKPQNEAIQRFPNDGTFKEFMERHLMQNEPCLFDESVTKQWRARQLWVTQGGAPNIDYLSEHYGASQVPVADCGQREFSAHPVSKMSLEDYTGYWKSRSNSQEKKLLYLKDWHFVREYGMECAYSLPEFFASDWLNEVWPLREDVSDDYRFVYMGPAGTWTPFHADVFRSYSWSANVCGCKEWLLFPPGEEENFRDSLSNLPFDITDSELQDRKKYPNAHKGSQPLRVIQRAGEIIFVPSGWYHQVKNLEDTISINHNWSNVFGVRHVWRHLQSELKLVQAELNDVRAMEEWDKQCQVVLKCSAGMDYSEFAQFLSLLSLSRLSQLQSLVSKEVPVSWLQELKSLVTKITSKPMTFFPRGKLSLPVGHQPPDCMDMILGSFSHKLQLPLETEDVKLLVSEMKSKTNFNLLLFRIYELQIMLSVLKDINI